MRYLLAVLLVLLCTLVLLEDLLHKHLEDRRIRASTLRPLAEMPVEQVRSFEVRPGAPPRTWTYVLRRGSWRYPDYFDAFVQPGRVDQLLGSLLQSLGTVVSTDPEDLSRFGLRPEEAVELGLKDASGAHMLEIRVGRGAPGQGAFEAYVKKAGSDTILHLHANPRLALGQGDPPMLDPHVLPRALERRSIAKIIFEHDSNPLQSLRRVQILPADAAASGRLSRGPVYAWLATSGGREDTCLSANAFAYTSFLTRMTYQSLRDPRSSDYGFSSGTRLRLEDEEGVVDVLEVGRRDEVGNSFLHHRTTGQVLAIAPQQAELLFPTRAALMDTLPEPSPYRLALPR